MATLLTISADFDALLALVEESGGELTKDGERVLDAWFAEIEGDRQAKVDGYCALVREHELKASLRREESERLAKRATADENFAKRLKQRLKEHMEHVGTPRIDTPRFTVSIQKNGGLAPLDISVPATALPKAYQRVTVAADTEAIRAALAKGEQIEGVVLQERGSHLRIR